MKMVWRLWALLYTAFLLSIIQESVCFRIKYEPDVQDEESNNSKSTVNNTQATQMDVLKKEPESDSNNEKRTEPTNISENAFDKQSHPENFKGIVRNPAMRRIIENEDTQVYDESKDTETKSPNGPSETENSNAHSNKVPESKIKSENNYSMKQSPAEVFKGFGRNPAFRRLVENEDPLIDEKLDSYAKDSQPDLPETNTESPGSESKNLLKNYADIESENSKSDIQLENKFVQPETAKPVLVNLGKEDPLVSASITKATASTELKDGSMIRETTTAPKPTTDKASKFLNAADLIEITQSSGKGEAQSVECDLPHFDVYSRCFANIMEVTVTSRSVLLGRISFQEAEGHIDMSGNTVIFYAVYGKQTNSGFMWGVQEGVNAEDVDINCNSCRTLDLRMIVLVMEELQEKNKRCVVDFTCTQPNMPDQLPGVAEESQDEAPQDSVITGPSTSRIHSAKTTLNILKGISMDSEILPQDHLPVELGTKLGISVSAYTREISLDLHILMCEARGEDGLTSALIKDGCSVHHMVEEFREVLGMVHDPEIDDHHMVQVTQHTTFEVFNFSPKPQTIAIICKIKMCGGECDERPGCVNSEVNLGHRKQKSFSVFYEEVVLGQMLNVAGVPEFAEGPKSSGLMANIIEPEVEKMGPIKESMKDDLDIHANCIPRSVFYLSLFILGGLFILLLVLALYFSKTIVLPRMSSYKVQNDEIESPSRALYQEYSSPRRRSPGSKSPDQHSTLDRIVYS